MQKSYAFSKDPRYTKRAAAPDPVQQPLAQSDIA
jgi:hypothetical protein